MHICFEHKSLRALVEAHIDTKGLMNNVIKWQSCGYLDTGVMFSFLIKGLFNHTKKKTIVQFNFLMICCISTLIMNIRMKIFVFLNDHLDKPHFKSIQQPKLYVELELKSAHNTSTCIMYAMSNIIMHYLVFIRSIHICTWKVVDR